MPDTEINKKSLLREVFTIDLRSLALFRICLGILLIVDLLGRACFLEILFTDQGFLPKEGILEAYGPTLRWTSLHFYTGSNVWLQAGMLLIAGAAGSALMLGYRTRAATIISWILFISINRRIPGSCYGFDDAMRLMLFWSFFLPLGARWSVDNRRSPTTSEGNRYFSIGTFALLLQVCFIYWFTALWKHHPDWLEGRAIQISLEQDNSTRALGAWLGTKQWITVPATYMTLIVEFFTPFVALSPWRNSACRWVAILLMCGLHLGILFLLKIGLFPYISIVYWLLFIPTSTWEWLSRYRGRVLTPSSAAWFQTFNLWESSLVMKVAVTIVLIQITLYNVLGLPLVMNRGVRMPPKFELITQLMRVDQTWRLYAPTPKMPDTWFLMPVVLANGKTYDTWLRQPVNYAKRERLAQTYRYYRIKMFLQTSIARRQSPVWPWIARYMVRDWNSNHPKEEQIQRIQVMYLYEVDHGGEIFKQPLVEYDVQLGQVVPISPTPIQPSTQ